METTSHICYWSGKDSNRTNPLECAMHIIWFLVDGFRLCLHPGGKTMKGQRTITEVNPERKVPPVLQFDKDQFEYNYLTEAKCFTLEGPR